MSESQRKRSASSPRSSAATAPQRKKQKTVSPSDFGSVSLLSEKPRAALIYAPSTVDAKELSWSDLSQKAVDARQLIVNHEYKVAATKAAKKVNSIETSHTHGEFLNIVRSETEKHNISTAVLGSSARKYSKILNAFNDDNVKGGAKDALRVIKGTHLTEGLTGSTPELRKAAVELGAEIGISEYVRGTTAALFDASINLYRIKHGKLSKKAFADPKQGYIGAGEGGAERVRAIETLGDLIPKDSKKRKALFDIYTTHASKKEDKSWAKEGADKWLQHKFKKWTQRE